jgi:hypothetical protein
MNVFCMPPSVAQHACEVLTCASLSIHRKSQVLTLSVRLMKKNFEKNFGTLLQNQR